jgi:hypothetical protein
VDDLGKKQLAIEGFSTGLYLDNGECGAHRDRWEKLQPYRRRDGITDSMVGKGATRTSGSTEWA